MVLAYKKIINKNKFFKVKPYLNNGPKVYLQGDFFSQDYNKEENDISHK